MKKTMIICLLGVMIGIPMSVQAASCAGGAGIEIKGNDHGTYCRARINMNWWSAQAWCDAIGMKLVPIEECNCNDESKCDMTKSCPNLYDPSAGAWVWTATPHGASNAHRLSSGNVSAIGRHEAGQTALCY